MSIFIVGFPAAVIGSIIEYAIDRLTKPRMVRGGYTFRQQKIRASPKTRPLKRKE